MPILQRVFGVGAVLAGVCLSMVPLAPLHADETPTAVETNTLSPDRSLFLCVQAQPKEVEPPPLPLSARPAVTAEQLNPAPVCSNEQVPQPRERYAPKGHPGLKQPLQPLTSPQAATNNYSYADAYQYKTSVGAWAFLSQHMPYLAPSDYHSLAEIAVESSDHKQIVEVGWTVDRGVNNNDTHPHLFVYHWVNGNTSCYNGCGFVQRSSTRYPGMTVAVTSSPQQYAIEYYNGNWWVWYQSEWIGYFPGSLWSNQFTQDGEAQWFGEVSSSSPTSCTQMGDGIFGTSSGSAAMTSMRFILSPTVGQDATSSPYVTNSSYYNVGNFTGNSFQYGGPGGQCQ